MLRLAYWGTPSNASLICFAPRGNARSLEILHLDFVGIMIHHIYSADADWLRSCMA